MNNFITSVFARVILLFTLTLVGIVVVSLLSGFVKKDQNIFETNDGTVTFISTAPLEVIAAESKSMSSIIDADSRTFIFSVKVSSFLGFNSDLQGVHFYENYMEGDKFPTATFKGKIIEEIDLTKDGKYEVRAKGILSMHGIDQERIIKGVIETKNNELQITSAFTVQLEDHDIKIPKVVNQKIAPEISVNVTATLRKKI